MAKMFSPQMMERMKEWNLACTNVDTDDEGCARFVVNSNIKLPDDPDSEAAAKLMESAPDLLVACEAMVHAARMDDPALGGVAAALAAAAIAKAKG